MAVLSTLLSAPTCLKNLHAQSQDSSVYSSYVQPSYHTNVQTFFESSTPVEKLRVILAFQLKLFLRSHHCGCCIYTKKLKFDLIVPENTMLQYSYTTKNISKLLFDIVNFRSTISRKIRHCSGKHLHIAIFKRCYRNKTAQPSTLRSFFYQLACIIGL